MVAKKKGAGGSLTRNQVVTVRLDPKLKFAAELAARKQRRTISSFVEWAVEQALSKVVMVEGEKTPDGSEINALEAIDYIWDVDDADRFFNLGYRYPELLNFDEERKWKLINEHPYFWKQVTRSEDLQLSWDTNINNFWFDRLREQWEVLNQIIDGRETRDSIPDRLEAEIDGVPMPSY